MSQECEFDCPKCKGKKNAIPKDGLYRCGGCGGTLSMKVGERIQPLGTTQAILKAHGSGRVVMVTKGK